MAILRLNDWNLITVLLGLKVCEAFEFCEEKEGPSFLYTSYMYCEYSCCGYIYNRYCCENFSGLIAGAVVGSLIFLGITIGVIICILKKKGHRGAVITPGTGGGQITTQHSVAFVTSTQIAPNYSHPPPAYGVAPGYQATYSYQPMYGGAGGTYPPPPPPYQDSAYPPSAPPRS